MRGTGPGLLLAHGAGGGIDPNYGAVMDVLAAHRTVVGPDYPGTGRTPRAETPLTLDGLVATAVEEGVETFAISGYSLGCPVAVRAATRHPDRVTALVLTAGFAHPNPRLLLAARLWRDLLRADDLDAALEATAASVPPGTPPARAAPTSRQGICRSPSGPSGPPASVVSSSKPASDAGCGGSGGIVRAAFVAKGPAGRAAGCGVWGDAG
ncbi:hypothetical protein GCM10022221_38870 [Actinocorallia aurea]